MRSLVDNINMEQQMLQELYVFQKPSSKIKNIFTRVLKGHIAVFNTNLNKINTGKEIDKRARIF